MKIAIIADIHGNLPALEAVLKDIDKRRADSIICLGDMVGKGPNSREVIDICRDTCQMILMGNWEYFLHKAYQAMQHGGPDQASAAFRWYINQIGHERMEYIGSLPHGAELTMGGKLVRIFHAHPCNFTRYFPDSPIEQRLELFGLGTDAAQEALADIAIYADIHTPYLQVIHGRQLLNTGSVGNPMDICQASYVILEDDSEILGTHFIRVPYNIAKAVENARSHQVPDLEEYIVELETATYFKRS